MTKAQLQKTVAQLRRDLDRANTALSSVEPVPLHEVAQMSAPNQPVSPSKHRTRGRLSHGHRVGGKSSPEYGIWKGIRQRCLDTAYNGFQHYGGRGIGICARWDSFENFLADMGPRPSPQHSIDRYPDPDGNYEPTNCRWATSKEQARNRSSNRIIEFNGRSITTAE